MIIAVVFLEDILSLETIGHKIWPFSTNTWSKVQIYIIRKRPKHHQWWWQPHLWTKSDFPEEGRYWTYYNRICLWRTNKPVIPGGEKKNQSTLINVLVIGEKKQRWLSWKKSLACLISFLGNAVPFKMIQGIQCGFAIYQGV